MISAEEMVCVAHQSDQLGTYAVFHSLPNPKDPTDGRTFMLPIRDKREFPVDKHVILHRSYTETNITDMDGNLLKRIRL